MLNICVCSVLLSVTSQLTSLLAVPWNSRLYKECTINSRTGFLYCYNLSEWEMGHYMLHVPNIQWQNDMILVFSFYCYWRWYGASSGVSWSFFLLMKFPVLNCDDCLQWSGRLFSILSLCRVFEWFVHFWICSKPNLNSAMSGGVCIDANICHFETSML